MCGIVGYIGPRSPLEVLLEGLRRLEYRGYDSAGVAVFHKGRIEIRRVEGKIAKLAELVKGEKFDGHVGIGHTRWATHGRPSETNAHPHLAGRVAVVHNGIIENYLALKKELQSAGRQFISETDTEVIAHLVDEELRAGKSLPEAVREGLKRLKGSYAVCFLVEGEERLVAARMESPMVIGIGDGEYFAASDVPAVLPYTRDFLFLEDGDIALISPEGVSIFDLQGRERTPPQRRVDWSPAMAEKEGYKHFMLKEIHEQPRAVTDTLRGRVLEEEGEVFFGGFPLN